MNKCDDVLTEVHNIKPSVLLLQETKLPQISTQKARSFHPAHLNNFAFKPSTGAAGGILNAVSQHHFTINYSLQHNFALSTLITSNTNNQTLLITNVYAPTEHSLKHDFLLELQTI
jgi:exonuclease III